MTENIDRARLMLMLNDLRLPAIKQNWPDFAERADKEGWPATRFLAALAEHEIPNATAAAWHAILQRPNCCRERPSTASTSAWCR
jgi:hypothetical protein